MSIRTTVTLEKDVYDRTKHFSKTHGIPFREALNELVRKGLVADSAPRREQPFRIQPLPLGTFPGHNYDDIEGLIEYLEGPYHR